MTAAHAPARSLLAFTLVAAAALALSAPAQADPIRYRYVDLDKVPVPAPYTFFYGGTVIDGGRVYGNVCDAKCTDPSAHIAFYENGAIHVLPPVGWQFVTSNDGVTGGQVAVNYPSFDYQAAIFDDRRTTLVPRQPGENYAFIFSVNDQGQALLWSQDAHQGNNYFYDRGKKTALDPAWRFFNFSANRSISDRGLIAGTAGDLFGGATGFRHDPRTGKTTTLPPWPGDPSETLAWGLGINDRDEVLGYSFVITFPYHERIGVWDQRGVFHTHLVENVSSNSLLFNNRDEIIITEVFDTLTSYLVPSPGVRLDLATLVRNLPVGQQLYYVGSFSDSGDVLGSTWSGNSFLLERLGDNDAEPDEVKVEPRKELPPREQERRHRAHAQRKDR